MRPMHGSAGRPGGLAGCSGCDAPATSSRITIIIMQREEEEEEELHQH